MKTHYDPYMYEGTSGPEGAGEYYSVEYEKYMCGSRVNHDNDIEITWDWNKVTCKRCLKQRNKIEEYLKKEEEEIVKSYGDMAEFMMKEENKLEV